MGLITYENLEDGQKVTANVFNERFAQIVAQLNGNIDENNIKDDGITKEKLKAEIYESMYPIGSQYVNFTDSTNPATLLGFGTWQAVAGRVVVGYDGTQTEFNAAEKTGGHKELQAHTHDIYSGYGDIGSGVGDAYRYQQWGGSNRGWHGGSLGTSSAGGGNAGNLQPYITAYVWKRVS